MKTPFLVFALFLAVLGTRAADVPGLNIGDRAPVFKLVNATGGDVSLAALLAKAPVAIAFVRSADWCPFCRTQLQELQKNLSAFEEAGIQVIAISYDPAATNAAAAKKLGLTLPLLSDPGSKVIDAYGVRNPEARGRAAGVPHPVLFIIDRGGTIRAKLAREGYRERPETAEIIAAARQLR